MMFAYDHGRVDVVLELLASLTTLAGIALGSTTRAGALLYLASNAVWWMLVVRRRMWGIVPLNIGVLVLTVFNLHAVGA